jgi:hypothetical protein
MGSELADDVLDVVAQGVDADEQPLGDSWLLRPSARQRRTAVSRWVRASPE